MALVRLGPLVVARSVGDGSEGAAGHARAHHDGDQRDEDEKPRRDGPAKQTTVKNPRDVGGGGGIERMRSHLVSGRVELSRGQQSPHQVAFRPEQRPQHLRGDQRRPSRAR